MIKHVALSLTPSRHNKSDRHNRLLPHAKGHFLKNVATVLYDTSKHPLADDFYEIGFDYFTEGWGSRYGSFNTYEPSETSVGYFARHDMYQKYFTKDDMYKEEVEKAKGKLSAIADSVCNPEWMENAKLVDVAQLYGGFEKLKKKIKGEVLFGETDIGMEAIIKEWLGGDGTPPCERFEEITE